MDQPPAVALAAFADVWPRATEKEIGTALCAIGAGRTSTLTHSVLSCWFSVFWFKLGNVTNEKELIATIKCLIARGVGRSRGVGNTRRN